MGGAFAQVNHDAEMCVKGSGEGSQGWEFPCSFPFRGRSLLAGHPRAAVTSHGECSSHPPA